MCVETVVSLKLYKLGMSVRVVEVLLGEEDCGCERGLYRGYLKVMHRALTCRTITHSIAMIEVKRHEGAQL